MPLAIFYFLISVSLGMEEGRPSRHWERLLKYIRVTTNMVKVKNAKNWHTRCARWWNDFNIEHTLNTLWRHSDDFLCPNPSSSSSFPVTAIHTAQFILLDLISVIIIVELGQSYHHEDHPDQMLGILEGCLKCQYLRLAASTSYKCIHTALTSRWNIILTLQLRTSWWK